MVGIVFNFRGLEDGKAYRRGHTRPNSLRCHLLALGILPVSCLAIGIKPARKVRRDGSKHTEVPAAISGSYITS